MRKVKMIDINTITLNGIVSAVFIRTIAVVIAPGPASIGTASGKIDDDKHRGESHQEECI